MPFKTATDLAAWLQDSGIDTSRWGAGTSKTAVDLWQEMQQGESTIQGLPPERVVRVVQIIIQQADKVLIESEQVFHDSRRRHRKLPPSDKIQAGETPEDAVFRCLREELGVAPDQVSSLSKSGQKQIKRDSPSYPGLVTRYEFIIFDTAVSGLPLEDFWHENTADATIDPVRRHHWAWVSREQYFSEL